MAKKKYKQATIDAALEQRERGLTYSQISKKTGMTASSVQYHCHREGVTSPKPTMKYEAPDKPTSYMRNGKPIRLFTKE